MEEDEGEHGEARKERSLTGTKRRYVRTKGKSEKFFLSFAITIKLKILKTLLDMRLKSSTSYIACATLN